MGMAVILNHVGPERKKKIDIKNHNIRDHGISQMRFDAGVSKPAWSLRGACGPTTSVRPGFSTCYVLLIFFLLPRSCRQAVSLAD
jgi:hypothetical protein